MESLEENCLLTSEHLSRKTTIITELFKINEEEELYWYQRSHDKQLHDGDNNTEYFHRVANGRKRKKNILSMEDGTRIIEGDEDLLNHATTYYKNLFGPEIGNAFPLDPSLWNDEKSE